MQLHNYFMQSLPFFCHIFVECGNAESIFCRIHIGGRIILKRRSITMLLKNCMFKNTGIPYEVVLHIFPQSTGKIRNQLVCLVMQKQRKSTITSHPPLVKLKHQRKKIRPKHAMLTINRENIPEEPYKNNLLMLRKKMSKQQVMV